LWRAPPRPGVCASQGGSLANGGDGMSGIITRLALDTFSPEEMRQVRLAVASLPAEVGAVGLLILPRGDFYQLTRTREGVTLDLCDDDAAARLLAGGR